MGYATHKQMSHALLGASVPTMERIVLLDMALAVEDGSLVYSWGHDRLALAIGKEPGSVAAKSALSQRIIPSLIKRRMIVKTSESHRGHHAEYVLSVLEANGPRSEGGPLGGMGSGFGADNPQASEGMGSGSEGEWVAVSEGMGSAQTATPLPTHYQDSLHVTLRGARNSAEGAGERPLTDAQQRNVMDALQAVDARCDSIDVIGYADAELAHLDRLSADERRERITAWVGLRSRALTDAGDDLVEDDRLHDLLFTHGYLWPGPSWPTDIPGSSEAWTDYREESA